ncbi:valine--tRNA ligase-like [Hylaeus anthracinus]|uniref:valine--tRNA ligase-like n=1 Tax=Hylaeus anthracinus TaxID=313031 RepID=UPI0023B922D9|nr:valine--tRNA ligase-like [Hylaeus anthracinus]
MIIVRLNSLLRSKSYCKYCYNGCRTQSISDFPATFKSKDAEDKWYSVWEKNGYFAMKGSEKDAFKMVLPPPNITGTLHIGHALTVTIQDVLARWYRMKGHPVMWIPGLDHAGIATQMMIEKYLWKTKGVTKSDIGKEQFLSIIWEWKNQKEDTIKSQLKALGASLDWSKEYFTMNENYNNAVIEAFVTLNDKNLLYRKKDLINWSPALHSTISDIEVDVRYIAAKTDLHVPGYEKKITFGEIAHIAYPVENTNDEIVVATTRPETLFGDVAIAVHPDNEIYAKYIGQNVWHALRETYIPVIADSLVDKNFGTGALKITPAHDQLDYTIATNHQLDIIQVIDENGNITDAGNQFKGLPRFIAREKVLNELSNRGLLKGIHEHKMCLRICSRSQDIVEYMLKEQWFLKTKDMAQKAMNAVKEGHLKIVPTIHEESWYNWLSNIRDWCISRQLWWGHRIPAYYVTIGDKTEWIVARSENDAQLIAQNKYGRDLKLNQDQDVLDTWFSSGIVPFAMLDWPKKTEDFKKYYPLTLMETGHDIMFFWVARMVMLGIELTNRVPFNEVLLHGILCDSLGKKMSKTVGNVISPENIINGATTNDLTAQFNESYDIGILNQSELKRMLSVHKQMFPKGIPQCGTDALRMTLCSHNIQKNRINFDVQLCQTHKLFCNKIWQASRYIILMTGKNLYREPKSMSIIDRWILSRLSLMISTTNDGFMERNFHKSIESLKQFLHYEFCDFYLEATKSGFKSENSDIIASHTYCLRTCLEVFLRILAPVMPYLADELYTKLSDQFPEFLVVPSLMVASYPLPEQFKKWRDVTLDDRIYTVLELIFEIRKQLPNNTKKLCPEVHIVTSNPEDYTIYNETINLIKAGSKISQICIFPKNNYIQCEGSICYPFTSDCTLFINIQNSTMLEEIQKKKKMLSAIKSAAQRNIKNQY